MDTPLMDPDTAMHTRFAREGYLCPLTVFSTREAAALRERFEAIEREVAGNAEREACLRNDCNWVLPLFDEIARHPAILEPVAAVLGPDILALHVDVFVKEAGSPQFISWHQDLHYWGLDSDDEVTAWLALSPATAESGCMRFIPGSHKERHTHQDTFAEENMLTRGQSVLEIDETRAVYAELEPGQMSLHHGRLLHSSRANSASDRRIGVAIRYITPATSLAEAGEKMGASLVRGNDRHGNFELLTPPCEDFHAGAMSNWLRLRDIEEKILYAGTERAGG